jgi:hypothetical protein
MLMHWNLALYHPSIPPNKASCISMIYPSPNTSKRDWAIKKRRK